jgi:hypothetical protein
VQSRPSCSRASTSTKRESTREHYIYAVSFRAINLGPGIALDVSVSLADPHEEVFAELVSRAALMVGESIADFMGLRLEDQADDPTADQARGIVERGLLFATCRDRYGRDYVYFPQGGSRVRKSELPFEPSEWRSCLTRAPSRGAPAQGTGMGSSGMATEDDDAEK